MTNQNNSSNNSNKPIDHVRLGAIRAAIWQNTESLGLTCPRCLYQ